MKKFRLWLPGLKKLSYDSFVVAPTGKVYVLSNGDFFSGKRHLWELDVIPETKDYILQQSTGLKDKNSREIYEGDIVKRTWVKFTGSSVFDINDTEFITDTKIVKYDIYNGFDFIENEFPMGWMWEVIGNIFENSELLK